MVQEKDTKVGEHPDQQHLVEAKVLGKVAEKIAENQPVGELAMLEKDFALEFNGLPVTLAADTEFYITEANNKDQAAELCHGHNLDCDFSHYDEEKDVSVTYSEADASRIETEPGPEPFEERSDEDLREEAENKFGGKTTGDDVESEFKRLKEKQNRQREAAKKAKDDKAKAAAKPKADNALPDPKKDDKDDKKGR